MAEQESRNFVFVGLGNPGRKYEMTRHNMGYLVIEGFAHFHKITLKEDKRLKAKVGKGNIGNDTIHLVLPTTYMNESGQAIRKYLDYYKLTAQDVVVVTDDVAIPFEEQRLRSQGSAGGHNGLKSVEQHLKTKMYTRLRLGIGRNQEHPQVMKNFVLDTFNKKEIEALPQFLDKGVKTLEMLLNDTLANVMNAVNSKVKPEKEIRNG